ncbi:MAG: hypothetical protein WC516_01470 [Patescibacteria group bacterium]
MVFIVLGYGVPENIIKDQNYNFYLRTVFNKVFDLTREKKNKKPVIILSGGKTDLLPPYKRSESGEMLKLFNNLRERAFVQKETKSWRVYAEGTAISTLENLVNSKILLKKKNIKTSSSYVFCEQTRHNRINTLAKKIFGKNVQVLPIDFDNASNRYLDDKFIQTKEKGELGLALWALKNKENFEKCHKLYLEKFKYFREAKKSGKNINFIKDFWQTRQKELINNLK